MTHTSHDVLEFGALKELLHRYVSSPAGHAEVDLLRPSTSLKQINTTLEETGEAVRYLQTASQPQPAARGAAIRIRFDGLPDPVPLAAKLAIGGITLEALEIREVIQLLDRACDIRAVLVAAGSRFKRLAARAARIGEFRPLLKELVGKIEPDGSIADNASVALTRIRRDMDRQQRLIQESLERFIKRHREDGILQEEFIAIRNERFVLPVVSGQKRRVDGIIHAASGTGHTLFIEPIDTVELNNDLVRLREQERREVYRILAEMTGKLQAASGDIQSTVEELAALEMLFAKAQFSSDFGCTIPVFSGRLSLVNARHPLLIDVVRRSGRKPVVPMSVTLEGGTRILLISGPNTGGKTVALKTVGLLALMAQSGLPVPADEATLPLFDEVLADVGDNQSIEQSLSSFSAHVARIREILTAAGQTSLVLLDELGRATDPDEGGALAVAILDHVRQRGSYTIASTHLLAPKVYGATVDGVLSAAMSFDRETLSPTYELRVGAPGASAGLDIAQRLGLADSIIDFARSSLTEGQRQIAGFIEALEQRLTKLSAREAEVIARAEEVEVNAKKMIEDFEKREHARLKELERRSDYLLAEFEKRSKQVDEMMQKATEHRKAFESMRRQVSQANREFRDEVDAATSKSGPGEQAVDPSAITEGARVRLRGVRDPARVRKLINANVIEVEAGFLKLQVSREDVVEVLPADTAPPAKLPAGVSLRTAPRADHVTQVREINLIGRRAEEAVAELDKFLDSAALASVERVRIVHGHGMGVLKRAVAGLLKNHPLVAKFRAADQHEGGAGATIAELRTDFGIS